MKIRVSESRECAMKVQGLEHSKSWIAKKVEIGGDVVVEVKPRTLDALMILGYVWNAGVRL